MEKELISMLNRHIVSLRDDTDYGLTNREFFKSVVEVLENKAHVRSFDIGVKPSFNTAKPRTVTTFRIVGA
jgi:hypothetical protein